MIVPFAPKFYSLVGEGISGGLIFVTCKQTNRLRNCSFSPSFCVKELLLFSRTYNSIKTSPLWTLRLIYTKGNRRRSDRPFKMILMKFNVLFLLSGGKDKMKVSLLHSISVNVSLGLVHTCSKTENCTSLRLLIAVGDITFAFSSCERIL